MSSTEQKQLLEDLQEIENKLRGYEEWGLFSSGIVKEAHKVLGDNDASRSDVTRLFIRFLDERVTIMLSVHTMLLQQKEMEKVTLEGKCVKAREKRQRIEQEMMSLRSENIEHKKLIEQLKDDIEKLNKQAEEYERIHRQNILESGKNKNMITGVQGLPQENDLSKYVKPIKPVPGPTGPLESLWQKLKK